MPRITVNITKKLRRIYDVRDGTTIGRDPSCEIQLLNKSVSRIHARFELDGAAVKIIDLASANGVKVNGERVKERVLEDGNEIKIGKLVMHFEAVADEIASENKFLIDASTEVDKLLLQLSVLNAFSLKSPTEREPLDILCEVGEGFIRSCKGFSSYDGDLLSAAMREAIGNAEFHGNQHNPGKSVSLTFRDAPKELKIVVEDEGPGFDFAAVLVESRQGSAVEAVRKRADKGKLGGLGIRLILSAADHVNYLQEGSCVEIVKNKHTGMSAVETQMVTVTDEPGDFIDEDEGDAVLREISQPAAGGQGEKAPTFDIEGGVLPELKESAKQATEKELDLGSDTGVELLKSPSAKPDTWNEDIAITPPPVADFQAAQAGSEAGGAPGDGDELLIDEDEVIEEIAELEDLDTDAGTQKLHSTTWYVRKMEKKRESERIQKINLDEEDEDDLEEVD